MARLIPLLKCIKRVRTSQISLAYHSLTNTFFHLRIPTFNRLVLSARYTAGTPHRLDAQEPFIGNETENYRLPGILMTTRMKQTWSMCQRADNPGNKNLILKV